ncbi:hypothetical protein [Streptomyces sp. NPDC060194]|uniref:hypothetical protein n=1 Tax=Streptomyces sp. NPDC060194 TaxID=3347069 RepID=UPI00365D690A
MSAPHPHAAPPGDAEQAEAALVEHYPRLVRLAYLVLPPARGRERRVLRAHALVQRSLPPAGPRDADVPAPRASAEDGGPGLAAVRRRVLAAALAAGRPRGRDLPPLLPQVWGVRLLPHSGGADELALEQRLDALDAPARAAFVLRGLERLGEEDARRALAAAGVADPDRALAEADTVPHDRELLRSPAFDPCALQARPTDLVRRRRRLRAGAVAGAALVVCGALLGLPGGGWGPDGGAAAAPGGLAPAAEAALDPGRLTRAAPTAWRDAVRRDFSVWPARGELARDGRLLGRALAAWTRPGAEVRVSATRGTPTGPPPGPARLLYAGEVDRARVVLLHDGLRVVRYAEPRAGARGGVALDFARTDAADAASAAALVVTRADGNVRYLTAPWVRTTAVRDLLRPEGNAVGIDRTAEGVTDLVPGPFATRDCTSWNVLEVRAGRGAVPALLLTDLGELTPARLLIGPPRDRRDVSGAAARAEWARTACLLPALRSQGVRSVANWRYAEQELPEGGGTARWLCTRADTWRGDGSRIMAQVQAPGPRTLPGSVAARAADSPACGPRRPVVLAGVLWKAPSGRWYVLAAGSPQITAIRATGGAPGDARGNLLAAPTRQGASADLKGRLSGGGSVAGLR